LLSSSLLQDAKPSTKVAARAETRNFFMFKIVFF
jgi:hypothetical protein